MIEASTLEGIVKISSINANSVFMEKKGGRVSPAASGAITNWIKNLLKNHPGMFNFAKGTRNFFRHPVTQGALGLGVMGGMHYYNVTHPFHDPSEAGYQEPGQREGAWQTIPQSQYKPMGDSGFWHYNQ